MTSASQTTTGLILQVQHRHLILLGICVVGFCISITINYPGFMSWDSADQLIEARNGIYSDAHPPFMALLWHFTDQVVQGPFGLLLLITALIWAGAFLVAWYWFNKEQVTLLSLLPVFIVFYPPLFAISGAMWKDNLMWGFLMLAIGTAGSLEPVSPMLRWDIYVKLAIVTSLLFLAMLVRHNAGFATVPIMMLAIRRTIGRAPHVRNIAVSGAIGLLSCLLLQFCAGLTTEYLATYKTNPWAWSALFDVGGIIYRIPDHKQQQSYYAQLPARLQSPASLEGLLETYDPGTMNNMMWGLDELLRLRTRGNALNPELLGKQPAFGCAMDKDPSAPPNNWFDTYCFEFMDEEKNTLIQLWSTLVIHYPLAWLSHRTAAFKRLIRFPYDSVWMEQHPGNWAKIYGDPTPKLNRFQKRVKSLLVDLTPISRPWIYLVLTTSIIAVCLLSLTEERLQIIFVAASGLAYEGGLFFLAASGEYRYSHYMIYTSVIALLLLLRSYQIAPHEDGASNFGASSRAGDQQ